MSTTPRGGLVGQLMRVRPDLMTWLAASATAAGLDPDEVQAVPLWTNLLRVVHVAGGSTGVRDLFAWTAPQVDALIDALLASEADEAVAVRLSALELLFAFAETTGRWTGTREDLAEVQELVGVADPADPADPTDSDGGVGDTPAAAPC